MGNFKPRSYTSNANWLYSKIYNQILCYKNENMEKTIHNIEEHRKERTYIRHCLSFLVPDDPTPINILADCLNDTHRAIVFPNESEREKEPYWNILNNEIHMKQWKKAEFYIDNCLIFKVIT